jgi:hypothetical protein
VLAASARVPESLPTVSFARRQASTANSTAPVGHCRRGQGHVQVKVKVKVKVSGNVINAKPVGVTSARPTLAELSSSLMRRKSSLVDYLWTVCAFPNPVREFC